MLVRCVDNMCTFNMELEEHWWRIINMEILSKAGVIINPDKIQFVEWTVDFTGFRVTEETVEPLPKYIESIRQFLMPRSTTDIRSWFGLINQAMHYSKLRAMVEPFWKFLSPKVKFEWNESLERAFQESKETIIEAIVKVSRYLISRRPA